ERQHVMPELLDPFPFFGSHRLHHCLQCSRLISRSSQPFAIFQSSITVSSLTFRTAAVSLTLRPPKNRISTTRAFRGAKSARALSASSSAIRFGSLLLSAGII